MNSLSLCWIFAESANMITARSRVAWVQ